MENISVFLQINSGGLSTYRAKFHGHPNDARFQVILVFH